jgi:hypothetical protein
LFIVYTKILEPAIQIPMSTTNLRVIRRNHFLVRIRINLLVRIQLLLNTFLFIVIYQLLFMIGMNVSNQLLDFLIVNLFIRFRQFVHVLTHRLQAVDQQLDQIVRVQAQIRTLENFLNNFETHDVALGVCLNYDLVYYYLNHTNGILMDQRIRSTYVVDAKLVTRICV